MFAFCHWGSVHAQDLGFECLLISKCDTELLNKVCDSLHPAWVAARRGCIITTNLVRICSLVLAGREQRVEFNISVFLSWGLPQLSNLSPSFRPACDGSWIIPSLKLRTKNPLKNQQIFFYFFFFLSLLVLKIISYPVFTVFTPMVESSVWSVTLQEVSLFVFVCISSVCPFWKCSTLLLKANQSSPSAFCR